MNELKKNTEKIYYRDQYAKSCRARIVDISGEWLEIDRTVAYPEGGGQESDIGYILTPCGLINFCAVKLIRGIPISIDGFHGGKSGGGIVHQVEESDLPLLSSIEIGMPVTVHLDVVRRQKLTLSHSASHFLYAAVLEFRPELKESTIGCHIKEGAARFDFFTETPFVPDEVRKIEESANVMMLRKSTIHMRSHPQEPDARTWIYEDIHIPCGGTHLSSPENIGEMKVTRKKLGKNKERIACVFGNANIDILFYHENDVIQ